VEVSDSIYNTVHHPDHYVNLRNSNKGHVIGDTETYMTDHSFQLALNSAGGAAGIAEHVWKNNGKGFALCRPPGHHATYDQSMGFCLINNIAIAAEFLIHKYAVKRVAIVDIDVHHGNGTQDIFYDRSDVFFTSIHQIPLYPMSGFSNEKGNGDGTGFTMNIPLPPFSGDQSRIEALETLILPTLSDYSQEIVLISVGYDAHWKDPLSQQMVSIDNYAEVVKSISDWTDKNCNGKIALFLEGGYDLNVCASASLALSKVLLGEDWNNPIGKSTYSESDQWKPELERIRREWNL
jgi:acetoin utilization deacetylase AcuC-like enzyme